MFGEAGKLSEFVIELIAGGHAMALNPDGSHRSAEVCPTCGQSVVMPKVGKYGPYDGCASFPTCRFTRKVSRPATKKPTTWAKKVARRKQTST